MYKDHVEFIEPDKRLYGVCIAKGMTPLRSMLVSSVLVDENDIGNIIGPTVDAIEDPSLLSGIDIMADLIHYNVENNKRIAIVTDYDSDGINSAYVLFSSLVDVFKVPSDNVEVIINKRVNGNGITDQLLETIIAEHEEHGVDIIITADHGSANGESIEILESKGITVCVTDHHIVPTKDSANNASAFVNPQKDDNSPFKYVSGCAVAYFVMLYMNRKYNKVYNTSDSDFVELLPMVAVSTIGDSMNMSCPMNRVLVRAGITVMNRADHPFWQVVSRVIGIGNKFDFTNIGFKFVPLLNSASRMGTPDLAFLFYNSKETDDVVERLKSLIKVNTARREKQKKLAVDADIQCLEQGDSATLVPVLKEGLGINGIVSSMLGERYFKPIVTFVETENGYAGSGRAINPNLNINEVFKNIDKSNKEVFDRFGGHKGASGCTVNKGQIENFKTLFEFHSKEQLEGKPTDKIYKVFKPLAHRYINEGLAKELELFAPTGVGFTTPFVFGKFYIKKASFTSAKEEHLVLTIVLESGRIIRSIIFNFFQTYNDIMIEGNRFYYLVFRPYVDSYRGRKEFKFDIKHIFES